MVISCADKFGDAVERFGDEECLVTFTQSDSIKDSIKDSINCRWGDKTL